MLNRANIDQDKALIGAINELNSIVQKAKTNFTNLNDLLKSLRSNNLVDDPNKWGNYEFRTSLGIYVASFFKPRGLDPETNKLFVNCLREWLPLVTLFADKVENATKPLAENTDSETVVNVLKNLSQANRPEDGANLLLVYLKSFLTVHAFVRKWNELDASVKDLINAHCLKTLGLGSLAVDNLFSYPFKHITSLQLHLKTMATLLDKYPDDVELKEIAQGFHSTSEQMEKITMEFNRGISDSFIKAK